MIEIYLFVNPLGTDCYYAEKQILHLVQTQQHKKIQFRFVPFVNMHVVDYLFKKRNLPKNDLTLRNEIFQTLYSAALDYKAVLLQGKKKGRNFLLALQKICGVEKVPYTQELVEQLVTEVGGDLAEFLADRQSAIVKEAFFTDQQIAHDMSIQENPSCVVYNYSCERDFGVLLEGDLCKEVSALKDLCQTEHELSSLKHGLSDKHHIAQTHLHLI